MGVVTLVASPLFPAVVLVIISPRVALVPVAITARVPTMVVMVVVVVVTVVLSLRRLVVEGSGVVVAVVGGILAAMVLGHFLEAQIELVDFKFGKF